MAAAAKIVDGTELNQQATVTTDDFPGIYWGKSRGHSGVGGPERASPNRTGTKLDTWFQPEA